MIRAGPARVTEIHGTPIVMEPFGAPFGRTFVFQDPDGYAVAIHGSRGCPEFAPQAP